MSEQITLEEVLRFVSFRRHEGKWTVQDVNGDYWLFGKENGMDLLTWSTESGMNITDLAGHKLSFKGKEISPIYKVTGTLIANLIA